MENSGDNTNELGLSPREEEFAQSYCKNLYNGTKAWQELFPESADKTASQMSWEYLKRPRVQSRVQEIIEERKQRLELDGDLVIHELVQIATADLSIVLDENGQIDPIKFAAAPRAFKRALESVEYTDLPKGGQRIKIKMQPKIKALELLGKLRRLGLFGEYVENMDRTPKESDEYKIVFVSPKKDVKSDGESKEP